MKKTLLSILLCCGAITSGYSQHYQKDATGMSSQGVKINLLHSGLRGQTAEELLSCPKNSVKSGEFVNEGFVGFQSSDQGRPGFSSKFFQSFTDNYFKVNSVRSFAIFNTFDKEKIEWNECTDRGGINENFEMTQPIRLEVGFYKRDKATGLPGELVYKEEIDAKGTYSRVELSGNGKVYYFDLPLKKEISLESGYLSVSAVDMKDNPSCWYSVLTCESVPGNSAISINGELMFAGNHMTYCMMGSGEYSAQHALKLSEISLPGDYSDSKHQKVKVTVKNVGEQTLENIVLELLIDGKSVGKESIKKPVKSLETFTYIFETRVDCSQAGDHKIEVKNLTANDEGLCDKILEKTMHSLEDGKYCISKSKSDEYGHIKKVTCGHIDNESDKSVYSDYSSMKTPIKKGETLDLDVEYKPGAKYLTVWVDWNDNGTFDEEGEFIGFITDKNIKLSIPENAEVTPGDKRMRIIFSDELVGACSIYMVGETEDYTLTVVAPDETPSISANSDITIMQEAGSEGTVSETFEIANKGNKTLDGSISVKYYLPLAPYEAGTRSKTTQGTLPFRVQGRSSLRAESSIADPVPDEATRYVLKYDKGAYSAITPSGVREAVIAHRYGNEMISELSGMKLTSMDIYIADVPGYTEAIVYTGDCQTEPKDIVASKQFKATANSWNRVVFDKAVELDGKDIWIAIKLGDFKEGQFCIGVDKGPSIVGSSDLVNIGNGIWWQMGNYGMPYSFCLRANLEGEDIPAINWLRLSKKSFSIKPGEKDGITLSCSKEGLSKPIYEAEMTITSNDAVSSLKKVKVFFMTGNPASTEKICTEKAIVRYSSSEEKICIDAHKAIREISIYDIMGRTISNKHNPGTMAELSLGSSMLSECIILIQYEDGTSEAVKLSL